jgi:hypothetical protein
VGLCRVSAPAPASRNYSLNDFLTEALQDCARNRPCVTNTSTFPISSVVTTALDGIPANSTFPENSACLNGLNAERMPTTYSKNC